MHLDLESAEEVVVLLGRSQLVDARFGRYNKRPLGTCHR